MNQDNDNKGPAPIEEASGGQHNADKAAERIEKSGGGSIRNHQEALVDEAVEETFPASDPISPKRIT